ncbi:MAG: cytochrome C oxidase subunit IV family protein [Acidobacteria bacterium]|nr:cytochrome C oxidase subunit IV family protein [Acidobacteriota bacterium]MDA1234967.1 cytochrome C oxidase subunit IV family protein [Acidobacteriota bacterium]
MAANASSSQRLMLKVWAGLLALTLIEVLLAYIQLAPGLMLTLLMAFSVAKAAMIMGYFMHLKFDKPALTWMLVPPLIACIVVMIAYLLPDSMRALSLRP